MTAWGSATLFFGDFRATSVIPLTAEVGAITPSRRCGLIRDIGGGYPDTSSHGRVCFVILLNSNDGAMRFRFLKVIEAGL
jgi:hypothetical protein